MKIAVCISGQPRTWKECYKSWNRLFSQLQLSPKFINNNVQIDYFAHIWDFNTVPPHLWNSMNSPETNFLKKYYNVPKDEIDELVNLIKPKKFLIETSEISSTRQSMVDKIAIKNYPEHNKNSGSMIGWSASQLYGNMRCGELKRDYEIENGFEYDMCIRLRFDAYINQENIELLIENFNVPIKRKTIYSMHSAIQNEFPFYHIGDIFFYADSHTYDVISSFYDWIPFIRSDSMWHGSKIEEVFVYLIRMFGINNIRTFIDVQVKRLKY